MRGASGPDADCYIQPAPAAVARLIATHSLDAATERWHWLGERTICTLAQIGRAQAGVVLLRRDRGYSDADAAVAVEAGHALGSARRGIRAAGILVKTNAHSLYGSRGLTPPRISPADRGKGIRASRAAKAGDTTELDRRTAYEQAVGRVVRVALALVPSQPRTGRYRLPPVNDALAAALAGEDALAVAAVFPALGAHG